MGSKDETVFVNYEKLDPKKQQKSQTGNDQLDELSQMYLELGKAYYEGGFEDPLPELITFFDKITQLKQKKAERFCPNCGEKATESALFCRKCGHKLR